MTMRIIDPETHAELVKNIETAIKGYEGALEEIELQSKLIDELVEALEQSVELLHIIKDDWIDYDHVYSINDASARALISKAQSHQTHKPNEGPQDE